MVECHVLPTERGAELSSDRPRQRRGGEDQLVKRGCNNTGVLDL